MNASTPSYEPHISRNKTVGRTLVIDSVSRACSVALYKDGALIGGAYVLIGRGHAERLVPMVDALLNHSRVDQIAVNVGPGSFTGVRIGLSVARALALAWGVPCVGYHSLALLNAMLRAENDQPDRPSAIIMHGGHGEYFAALFDSNGTAQGECLSLGPDMLSEHLARPLIGGDAFDRGALEGTRGALDLLPDARCFHLLPSSAMIMPEAIYVRAPDAALPKAK